MLATTPSVSNRSDEACLADTKQSIVFIGKGIGSEASLGSIAPLNCGYILCRTQDATKQLCKKKTNCENYGERHFELLD
jgi:hypothetical protein